MDQSEGSPMVQRNGSSPPTPPTAITNLQGQVSSQITLNAPPSLPPAPSAVPPGKAEELKPAVSDSRWEAFKNCLLPLSPVPVTIAIVRLNLINYFAFDVTLHSQSTATEILDALQFGSHGYATLVVASVTAIVLHRIRYELAADDGIPLGCLLTGYELSNFKTLATREFWVGMNRRRPGHSLMQRISFVALIVWAIFTVNVASPLAAIAVIPKLGWWGLSQAQVAQESLYEGTTAFQRFFVTNSSELWPDHLTTSLLPDSSCLTSNATANETCPAGGYSTISETVPNWNSWIQLGWNITFFNDDASRNLVSYFGSSTTPSSWSIGQVLTRSLSNSYQWQDVDWKLTMLPKSTSDLWAPFVEVECNEVSASGSMLEFPYQNLYPGLPNSTHWVANGSDFLNEDLAFKPVQFAWVDLSQYPSAPSLGAAFRLNTPVAFGNQNFANPIFTCSVVAQWYSVEPSMEPLANSIVTPTFSRSGNFRGIRLDPEWAQALNVPLPGSNLTTMESLINALNYTTSPVHPVSDFNAVAAASIGLMVTDGLSRLGWNEIYAYVQEFNGHATLFTVTNNGTLLSSTTPVTTNPDWFEFDISLQHNGYSYSPKPITVRIAIAVLVLHGLVAVIHTITVCFNIRVWTSQSWSSVGELLLLSLNSRPDREILANTGAGARLTKTWEQPLKIREVEGSRLEMVLGADDDQTGEKNGSLHLYAKPQPDKVYG